MSIFKYPSLENPQAFGFIFDAGGRNVQYPQVDDKLLFFETYGDGMTQHSYEHPIPVDFVADYMASLAVYLLDNPDCVDSVRFTFDCDWPDPKADEWLPLPENKDAIQTKRCGNSAWVAKSFAKRSRNRVWYSDVIVYPQTETGGAE